MERGLQDQSPLALLMRRLWPDPNPLRRAQDRAEFAVAVLLLTAFLAGAPLTALAAARWAAVSVLRAEVGRAGRHQVKAVLLRAAPEPEGSPDFPAPVSPVPARWATPAGARTGAVYAPPDARAGSIVMIWVDRSGRLTAPPRRAVDMAGREFVAVVAGLVILSVALVILWAYAGIFLDWRRMAAWDADWAVTEPQWTGRR